MRCAPVAIMNRLRAPVRVQTSRPARNVRSINAEVTARLIAVMEMTSLTGLRRACFGIGESETNGDF